MKSFNQYFEDKQLVEKQLQNAIVEEENKKKTKEENSPAGWDTFEGNQTAVDMYVRWITKNR